VITITGLSDFTETGIRLVNLANGQNPITYQWYPGYGHVRGRPSFALRSNTSDPFIATTDAPFWHPELALNSTLQVILSENDTTLVDASLVNGTIGVFPGGNLSYLDADGDGYLSTGDSFRVSTTDRRFTLEVSVLFGSVRQAVALGP